jgi:hypothetical protein
MNLFVNAALLGFIPKSVKKGMMALAPVRRIKSAGAEGPRACPTTCSPSSTFPTRYDCREALAALKGSGIECPKLPDYAWRLWDYWERHLDPALKIDHGRSRHGRRQGRARHRRLLGHRPGGGDASSPSRAHHSDLRPRRGQARRGEEGDPRRAGQGTPSSRPIPPTSPTRRAART